MYINQKQIKRQLDELKLLGEVTLAFSQISSTRMRNTRGEVLSARDFEFSLHDIFKEVLLTYVRHQRSKRGEKITFLSHNGKTVALFISANTGLYGDIVNKTFDLFAKDIREKDLEVAIIGKIGLGLFRETFPNKPYTYFDHTDYGSDPEHFAEIIRHIVQYEKVKIYYGKYENVVKQIPAVYDIEASVPTEVESEAEPVKYIFEPDLGTILAFFESELFTSLFDQAVYESQLAKFASRMIAMDVASQKVEDRVKEFEMYSNRAHHANVNRKQQNTLTNVFFLENLGR